MSDTQDDFFTSLDNTKPYLKVAFEGFAGTGKTRTMAEVAIGLHKRIKSTKPIAVFDTEKAAMFLRRLFADNGIDPKRMVLYKESRTLADLKEVMRRGNEGLFDVLMVDSITHVWEDFLRSYQEERKRSRLQFEDWGVLKPKWKREFSEPFVRHRYHALMCGRAGYEYSEEKNSETGKREIYKSGIKMKVEGETAYEPDMLVLMERFEEVLDANKKVWRQATIIKDRSSLIDGKTFQNPTYKDFAPAVDFLLENPVVRDTVEQENKFESDDDKRHDMKRRREIACEKIQATLVEAWPGQTADEKRVKVEALRTAFGTPSWTEISEKLWPEKLEKGLVALRAFVEQKTRTGLSPAQATDGALNASTGTVPSPVAPSNEPALPQPEATKPITENKDGVSPSKAAGDQATPPAASSTAPVPAPTPDPAPAPSVVDKAVSLDPDPDEPDAECAACVAIDDGADPYTPHSEHVKAAKGQKVEGLASPDADDANEDAPRPEVEPVATKSEAGAVAHGAGSLTVTTPTAPAAATHTPVAPLADVKLTVDEFCARLGEDMAATGHLVCGLPAHDISGAVGSEVLKKAAKLHGEALVNTLWKQVGGEFTKGEKRPKRKPLRWAALRALVAQLPHARGGQDKATKETEPLVAAALDSLPAAVGDGF